MMGNTTRQNTANSLQPSIRAASRSSSDTPLMYWRMKKMPKALAAPGTMSGRKVLIQPNSFMST